jgi:hypothetical protein
METEELYSSSLANFSITLEKAIATSHSAAFRKVDERRYWAAILFTRLCVISTSILHLCPTSKLNGIHWDFGSVASLCRNAFECALTFYYLGVEDIPDEEWKARRIVMQLHDCMSRLRMFRDFDSNDVQLQKFEEQANELRSALRANAFFLNLPESQRNKLLKGGHANILSREEILQRMGDTWTGNNGLYKFYSAQTHSFPMGFYRMVDQNRGRGIENEIEKGYIGGALAYNAITLKQCTDYLQNLFADVAKFSGTPFNLNTLKRARKFKR